MVQLDELLLRILETLLEWEAPAHSPSAYALLQYRSYCYLGNRNDRQMMSRAVLEAIRDKIFPRLAPICPHDRLACG